MILFKKSFPQAKIILSLCFTLFLSTRVWGDDEILRKSVVKVFTTTQNIDYYEPWKPGAQIPLQGCGAIIPGHFILTTAHLVNKGNYIEVQKFGEAKRYVAKVEQVGYDLDLALLSVDDPDFFTGTQPVVFGDLPNHGDKLLIQGGDELSIKEDSVSNMEMVLGNEGGRLMPAILTDGPIDGSNNGCPVFSGGKFVGIPFDCIGKPDKTGSIIPINVIQRFFKAIQGGRAYDGLPDLGFYTEDLENPSLRDYFKISSKQSGEIITKIFKDGSADGILNEGDVLTAIDGHSVDDEGYINLPKIGRVPECYLATFYLMGEKMSLEILRDGKPLKIQMPLKPVSQLLTDRQDARHPTYFVMAGFVFVPLTVNYFSTASWDSFKPELQDVFFHGLRSDQQKQVILISHVLPHEINKGYDKLTNVVVEKINGRPITEMKDVLEAFDHPLDGFDVMDIDDHDWFGSTIVIDAAKAKQATDEINQTFKILSDRSQDLK
jgi:S1-C subfamily serine protease